MTFLLSEDEALRNLLLGMTVSDQKSTADSLKTVTNKSLTANVATLTTATAHGFAVGDSITVTGVGAPFNGSYVVTVVPTSTTVRYAKTNADITSAVATGTVTNGVLRKVSVYFGQPDQEIREQSYPYLTIDMIDIAEDFARAHRGLVKPDYLPDPTTSPSGTGAYDADENNWFIHYPVPVNIDYQITTYSRQPRHDRQILAQMLSTKIPMRFAVLEPDDGTVRRLDLLDVSKRDVTEQGKRLFMNAFTVRVSSEITSQTYTQVYKTLQVIGTGTSGDFVQGQTQSPFTAVDSWTNS